MFDRRALDFAGLLAELDDPTTERYLAQLAYYQGSSFPCVLGSGCAADRTLA
jgi:hypothetical protein